MYTRIEFTDHLSNSAKKMASDEKLRKDALNLIYMNQLSYEVLNKKFKDKGYIFKGNFQKSITKTINTFINSNN